MVQRKAATRLKPPVEPKKTDGKSEKRSPSNLQQDSKRKGVIDLKMMLKKVRSIKLLEGDLLQEKPPPQQKKSSQPSSKKKPSPASVSDRSPNYMKPTSSSHARKERPQVTMDNTPSTVKNKTPKISNNPSSSRPPSSSSDGSAIKSSRTLMRRLSLKLIRPWMKKSSEVDLNPSVDVSRATCSSTLKDSKFPNTLELNPGGLESEGTSVPKVCPYTYCSLNGHRHEPLPPLKRVISVRRRMLKNQKSMRLKGLSSFKVKGLKKSKKEIDTKEIIITRVPSVRAPLIEEVDEDCFIEIYAKPELQSIDMVGNDDYWICEELDNEISKALQGLSLKQGCEAHEEVDQICEYGSESSYEDKMDRYSELSIEEMDVIMEFLEYIEHDPEAEAMKGEDVSCFVPEHYAEWVSDCCLANVLGKEGESIAESIANLSTFESTDLDWEEEHRSNAEENADLCAYLDYGFGQMHGPLLEHEDAGDSLTLEADTNLAPCEVSGANRDLPQDLISDVEEERLKINVPLLEHEVAGDGLILEADITLVSCEVAGANTELPQDSIYDVEEERSKIDVPSSFKDEISAMPNDFANRLADVLNPNPKPLKPVPIEDSDHGDGNCNEGDDVSGIPNGKQNELEVREAFVTNGESLDDTILGNVSEEMDAGIEEFVECDDGNSIMKIQFSDSPQAFYEIDLELTEGTDEFMAHSEESITEVSTKPKARYSYVKRRTNEDVQEMRGFNPRAPRFLPELPEPDAEKVDLRHQDMEERKNAEEWMVDYALQRTVSKLARARSRKVRLFVEAFETIMQPPMCEMPQQHGTMDLDQARQIQSCR